MSTMQMDIFFCNWNVLIAQAQNVKYIADIKFESNLYGL